VPACLLLQSDTLYTARNHDTGEFLLQKRAKNLAPKLAQARILPVSRQAVKRHAAGRAHHPSAVTHTPFARVSPLSNFFDKLWQVMICGHPLPQLIEKIAQNGGESARTEGTATAQDARYGVVNATGGG
jgi:hypothetical protein